MASTKLVEPHGHFESTGVRPACMEQLEAAGVRLPANLFSARVLGY